MNTYTHQAGDRERKIDWKASISDNIAWALLVTTALLIFITMPKMKHAFEGITAYLLLVAMVGAIVLTHRQRPDGARGQQDIGKQVRRNPDEATVMKQPKIGEGVEL